MCVYIYIYTCLHVYIYIYIYMCVYISVVYEGRAAPAADARRSPLAVDPKPLKGPSEPS